MIKQHPHWVPGVVGTCLYVICSPLCRACLWVVFRWTRLRWAQAALVTSYRNIIPFTKKRRNSGFSPLRTHKNRIWKKVFASKWNVLCIRIFFLSRIFGIFFGFPKPSLCVFPRETTDLERFLLKPEVPGWPMAFMCPSNKGKWWTRVHTGWTVVLSRVCAGVWHVCTSSDTTPHPPETSANIFFLQFFISCSLLSLGMFVLSALCPGLLPITWTGKMPPMSMLCFSLLSPTFSCWHGMCFRESCDRIKFIKE